MFDLGLILVLRQCSFFVLRSAQELLVRGLVHERSLTSRLDMAEPLAGASKLDHVSGGEIRRTAGQQVAAQGEERTAAAFVHLALLAARLAAAVHRCGLFSLSLEIHDASGLWPVANESDDLTALES